MVRERPRIYVMDVSLRFRQNGDGGGTKRVVVAVVADTPRQRTIARVL
jgi:hypothetical protein